MNTQQKKEMLIKLAEELKEELGEDERLLLACSFDDKDKDEIVMYADLTYVGAVLCAICNDESFPDHYKKAMSKLNEDFKGKSNG